MAASPAFAAGNGPACDDRTDILRHLETTYSERPIALGVASNGGIVEVLATANGATWTLLITLPNGQTCLMAAGEDWESLPQVASGPEA